MSHGLKYMRCDVHDRFSIWKPWRWIFMLIRFFSRGKWNHSALMRSDGMVLEATVKGVKETPYTSWRDKDTYIQVWVPDFDYSPARALTIWNRWVDARLKYDFNGTIIQQGWHNIKLFFHRLFGDPSKKVRWTGKTDRGQADAKYYCSELDGKFWNTLAGKFERWYEDTPQELADQCHGDYEWVLFYKGKKSGFHPASINRPESL